ncbi:hypothetical protein V8G54_034056 [Vigna mungo]|uniref:Uncharacterized protein n=1 Tax=Vigna mungo TaxID=3915 RepID=A0AAQ3RGW6_VIGMU
MPFFESSASLLHQSSVGLPGLHVMSSLLLIKQICENRATLTSSAFGRGDEGTIKGCANIVGSGRTRTSQDGNGETRRLGDGNDETRRLCESQAPQTPSENS